MINKIKYLIRYAIYLFKPQTEEQKKSEKKSQNENSIIRCYRLSKEESIEFINKHNSRVFGQKIINFHSEHEFVETYHNCYGGFVNFGIRNKTCWLHKKDCNYQCPVLGKDGCSIEKLTLKEIIQK
ncbi:MAG: hypothetical protein PHX21_13130 [bacterium]|nr:hypothetical protein [bacterium]